MLAFARLPTVHLERVFTYRLIRWLRWTIPLLVLVLVAIPAWNYVMRVAQRTSPPKSGRPLPVNVSVHTEGFTFSKTEGKRTIFTVHAKSNLGFKDKKGLLQDVDVIVYGATEKDPVRNIHGDSCTYDQETSDFQFDGNVTVQLDEKTVVHTQQIIYRHEDGLVYAPKRADIQQEGKTGHANSLEYKTGTGLLKLTGDVHLETESKTELEADAVLFHQKENWATMDGNVFIKSVNGWVKGDKGRADLVAKTLKARLVTVDGNVTAESKSSSNGDAWKLRAGWLEATVSAAGNAERVRTRSNVEVEKDGRDSKQKLSGAEIDATLNDSGRVEDLEARQNARMVLGADQTLRSNQIRTNAAGSVNTTDNSVLQVGDSTIEGRDFAIHNAEEFVMFSTARRATLKSGEQQSSADRTDASFESRTNMLVSLIQSGNFQFRDAQRQGHAGSARFEDGGSIVTLEGSPVVMDSDKQIEAGKDGQIRLNQKENSFVATKNVSTVLKTSDQRTLVKASRAEGGSESILYTGNVEMWRENVYMKADRLEASGQNQENAKILAQGKVFSNLQAVRANSDKLEYDDAGGMAHYTGHVHAQKQDMIMETPDMIVTFRDKNVSDITASSGVNVTRANQIGTGERAVYEAATDTVTLSGANAQIRDKARGTVQSGLIMKKGDAVSAQSGSGGRTVTTHPVKK